MRVFRIALLVTAFACTSTTRADAPTPFVDGQYKVGMTYTEPGSIISLGGSSYLVVVTTDTFEHVVLRATAKKGVIKDEQLGRPVKIEAKLVAQKGKDKEFIKEHLEILSVK